MDDAREPGIESSPGTRATASTFPAGTPCAYISVIAAAGAASARPRRPGMSSGK